MTSLSGHLDYGKVEAHWNEANPSIFAPYSMDGFDFPVGAGRYRFRTESDV